ncbi:MAG TPA: hypothetical protein VFR79_02585 [Nitrospira sp.]|nr:hypothetical protein [Nitrospira sp.]
MVSYCELRWVHGRVAAVAAGDGETQCSKVRSDASRERTKFAEPRSDTTMRFHPSPEQQVTIPSFAPSGVRGRRAKEAA